MAMDYSGLFTSPDRIRQKQVEDLMAQRNQRKMMGGSMSGLLGQVAAGQGDLIGMGIARMAGLQTVEEKEAEQTQGILSGINWEDSESVALASKKLADAGLQQAALSVQEKGQQLEAVKRQEEAHMMQQRLGQSNLDTAALQRQQIVEAKKASEAATAQAAQEKAQAIKYFTESGNETGAALIAMGGSVEDALKLGERKGVEVDGVLVDQKTGEVMYKPDYMESGQSQYQILGSKELGELSEATGATFPKGAVVSQNMKTGELTFKHMPKGAEESIAEGYESTTKPDGTVVWQPIKGSPAHQQWLADKAKQEEALAVAKGASNNLVATVNEDRNTVDEIFGLMAEYNVTGWGALLSVLPASKAKTLENKVLALKSGKALKNLVAAKDAGATFGAMSNAEWEILEKIGQTLDPQDADFATELKKYDAQLMRVQWDMANNMSEAQLKEYGLEDLIWLKGAKKPPSITNYDLARKAFAGKSKARKVESNDEWAELAGEKTSAETPQPLESLLEEVNNWEFAQ